MGKTKRRAPARRTPPSKAHAKPAPKKRAPAPPPKKHAAPVRRVTHATRAKLSKQRLAYVRTGLRKAERELARAVAKVQRERAKLAALQARAVQISSAAQKSRATWAAVKAIQSQESVSRDEARRRHKARLAEARTLARTHPRPVWTAEQGREEQAFGLTAVAPDLPGRFPPNTLAMAHVRLEHWPAGMGQGEVRTELVSVPFQTGATFDEFWRNYHDALRVFTDAFVQAQGIADDRKTKSPTTTSYWLASIQAA